MTYIAIGELLNISKQRVYQILTGYRSPSDKLKDPIDHKILTISKRKLLGLPLGVIDDLGGRGHFRELVRMRDNHTCQICLKKWEKGERRLDVHHEDERFEGRSKEKGICKIDKENYDKMITLCHKCHLNLDSVRKKMRKENRLVDN